MTGGLSVLKLEQRLLLWLWRRAMDRGEGLRLPLGKARVRVGAEMMEVDHG